MSRTGVNDSRSIGGPPGQGGYLGGKIKEPNLLLLWARATGTAATAFRHELVKRGDLLRLQNFGNFFLGCRLELAHLFSSLIGRSIRHEFPRLLHLVSQNGTNLFFLIIRQVDGFLHGSNLTVEHLLWITTSTTRATTAFRGLCHHHSNEEEKEHRQRCDSLHDLSLEDGRKDNV